jgi:hypothetical protein
MILHQQNIRRRYGGNAYGCGASARDYRQGNRNASVRHDEPQSYEALDATSIWRGPLLVQNEVPISVLKSDSAHSRSEDDWRSPIVYQDGRFLSSSHRAPQRAKLSMGNKSGTIVKNKSTIPDIKIRMLAVSPCGPGAASARQRTEVRA